MSYRYTLTRDLSGPLAIETKTCLFVMLNPSTADATEDDPTIRRCIGFAKRENATDLTVGNLFAYRATKPVDLIDAHNGGFDIVGPDNDRCLANLLYCADLVIFGWGGTVDKMNHLASRRIREVAALADRQYDGVPQALGFTQSGQPRHPLMLRKDTRLESASVALHPLPTLSKKYQ